MKVLTTVAVALIVGAPSTTAFAPSASRSIIQSRSCSSLSADKRPFFASEIEEKEDESSATPEVSLVAAATTVTPSGDVDAVAADAVEVAAKVASENVALDALTADEEIEMLVQKEMTKSKKASKLKNAAAGVEYAPWMNISEDDESKIRVIMREKTDARRKRQEQSRDVSGNLFRDSQAQELSGTGLSYKFIDGDVELTWATKSERNTKGYIVKRRAAKTNDYFTIASHEDFGPLASKGVEGGVYKYLDTSATPGGWVYRITEEDTFGGTADVCQALIEVETEEEQQGALIAAVGFGVFAIAAVVAGITLDPMNGQ